MSKTQSWQVSDAFWKRIELLIPMRQRAEMFRPNFWPLAAALLNACAAFAIGTIALSAHAQQSASDAPANLDNKLEDGNSPDAAIRAAPSESQITESRDQAGRVTSVEVKTRDNTYYLKPYTPPGSALPVNPHGSTTRAPQWQLLEFGP